ncbi:MAG: GWxTD domain-containing protein [Candidatus Latescibacteria bacterium]|nr:GWxTD domain-containing protein [Candidatus Latescibacterota bacterium]
MIGDRRSGLTFCRMLGGILVFAAGSLGGGSDAQAISPAAADALYRRALSTQSPDSIRALVSTLKEALPGHTAPAKLLTQIGLLYMRIVETDSALSNFQRAVRQDPGLAVAKCGLGRAYLELKGDAKRALPHLKAAVEADSTNPDAHYLLAQAYLKLGKPEARREADRAIRYDLKYAPAYLLLAQAYQKEDNPRMAVLYYKKYLELLPRDQTPAYEFALDLLNRGRVKEAEEVASLMTDNRGMPVLAQILMRQGDYDRAMPAFQLYIDSLDPKEQDLYRDISLVGLPQEVEDYKVTSAEKQETFLRVFWLKRDMFKATGGAMRRAEHCRRVWYARAFYGQKKWPWDRRGEVYIRYGEPDYRSTYEQPNAKTSAKVQRVQDALAVQLYGPSGLGTTFVGPVFPIRTDGGRYMEAPEDFQKQLTSQARLDNAPDNITGTLPAVEEEQNTPGFTPNPVNGVQLDAEYAIGLRRWKPIVVGNNWAVVPWEVWIYTDLGKGLEVAFTDEQRNGIYDFAPIPSPDPEDLAKMDNDKYAGQTAYLRLTQRLTELAPAIRVARVAEKEPERFILPDFEPLDFSYEAISFRGKGGLTEVQVNIGIPVDNVALPGEADTTVLVDRRVALMNPRYTRLLPAQQDLEIPISRRTRGQGFLDRVDLEVPPGDYELAVQARRRNTGRIQSYEKSLTLPSYAGNKLGLSDLFIARQVAAVSDTSDPKFRRGAWRITPLPSHAFRAGEHVFVYFEIYNLAQDASGATRYEMAYQVRAAGAEGVSRSLPEAKAVDRTGETVSLRYERTGTQASVSDYVELDIGQAAPGSYAVRMTVKDLNGGHEVTKESAFWITGREQAAGKRP